VGVYLLIVDVTCVKSLWSSYGVVSPDRGSSHAGAWPSRGSTPGRLSSTPGSMAQRTDAHAGANTPEQMAPRTREGTAPRVHGSNALPALPEGLRGAEASSPTNKDAIPLERCVFKTLDGEFVPVTDTLSHCNGIALFDKHLTTEKGRSRGTSMCTWVLQYSLF
jgi:hypothetical protein